MNSLKWLLIHMSAPGLSLQTGNYAYFSREKGLISRFQGMANSKSCDCCLVFPSFEVCGVFFRTWILWHCPRKKTSLRENLTKSHVYNPIRDSRPDALRDSLTRKISPRVAPKVSPRVSDRIIYEYATRDGLVFEVGRTNQRLSSIISL